jgi:hypothetical protein
MRLLGWRWWVGSVGLGVFGLEALHQMHWIEYFEH